MSNLAVEVAVVLVIPCHFFLAVKVELVLHCHFWQKSVEYATFGVEYCM